MKEITIQFCTEEYQKGWQDALKLMKENLVTPDLCKSVGDCLQVINYLLETDD